MNIDVNFNFHYQDKEKLPLMFIAYFVVMVPFISKLQNVEDGRYLPLPLSLFLRIFQFIFHLYSGCKPDVEQKLLGKLVFLVF